MSKKAAQVGDSELESVVGGIGQAASEGNDGWEEIQDKGGDGTTEVSTTTTITSKTEDK